MKALTALASAAALAMTLAASAPVHAAVIAQFTPDTNASDYRWINNGGGNSGSGGHLISVTGNTQTTAHGVATHFSYLDGTLNNAAFIPAVFTLDATASSGHAATVNGAGVWNQLHVGSAATPGTFSFIYTGATIANFHGTGVTLLHNSNLLSGVFTDAWIQGAGGSGSFNLTPSNGGTLTFTSDYDHNSQSPATQEFAFNMLSATPSFGANLNASMKTFRSNGGGNFSAQAGVPEPATWGLLIVGFGGIGGTLRKRRRIAAA